jgi:hypothetical protein
MMSKKALEEERRLEIEQDLLSKASRTVAVKEKRANEVVGMKQKNWLRHERERVTRMQMTRVQNYINTQLQEKFILDKIQFDVRKRVTEEVEEHQRKRREELEQELRQARQARGEQLLAAAKTNERSIIRKEIAENRKAKLSQSRVRTAERDRWNSQERERRAHELMRKQEEKYSKILTRSLLKAHELLQSPILFEQSRKGSSVHSSARRDCSVGTGFVMSGGRVTHPKLLTPQTARSIIEFQSSQLSAGRASAAGASMNRNASPMSNVSL